MTAPAGPTVQLFGLADSRPTQAALRFFKERRVNATFVDLRRKPIAAGELRRFVERLGAPALLDADGRRYKELGLGYMGCFGCRSPAAAMPSPQDRRRRPGRAGWQGRRSRPGGRLRIARRTGRHTESEVPFQQSLRILP
jgi:hypothetical protein